MGIFSRNSVGNFASSPKGKVIQVQPTNALEKIDKSKPSRRTRLQQIFVEFCEETSLHGLGHVVNNRLYLVKFIWISLFFVAVGMNCFHLSTLVINYLKYPVHEVTTLQQKPTSFPQVSICNLEARSPSNFDELFPQEDSQLYKYFRKIIHLKEKGIIDDIAKQNLLSPVFMKDNIGNKEVQQIGHKLEDLVVRCFFGAAECNLSTDFSHSLNPSLYNCYTFHPGARGKNFSATGSDNGLSLILYTEGNNGEKQVAPYNMWTTSGNAMGVRLSIQPEGSYPAAHIDGVDIMPGHSGSVSYKVSESYKLSEPYGTCDDRDGEAYNRYSPEDCIMLCLFNYIREQCGCRYKYAASNESLLEGPEPVCGKFPDDLTDEDAYIKASSDLQCAYNIWLQFYANQTVKQSCSCPPRCSDIRYDYTTSVSLWPAQKYHQSFLATEIPLRTDKEKLKVYKQFKKYIDDPSLLEDNSLITDNFVRVNVFLRQMEVEHREQQSSYPLSQLFSDIGGTLGLWVGLSVLTIIEIFQLSFRSGLILFGGQLQQ